MDEETILRKVFYDEDMFDFFINQQETTGYINAGQTLFDKTLFIHMNHREFFEKYGKRIFRLFYKNIEFLINFYTDETGQYIYYALQNGEKVSTTSVGPFEADFIYLK